MVEVDHGGDDDGHGAAVGVGLERGDAPDGQPGGVDTARSGGDDEVAELNIGVNIDVSDLALTLLAQAKVADEQSGRAAAGIVDADGGGSFEHRGDGAIAESDLLNAPDQPLGRDDGHTAFYAVQAAAVERIKCAVAARLAPDDGSVGERPVIFEPIEAEVAAQVLVLSCGGLSVGQLRAQLGVLASQLGVFLGQLLDAREIDAEALDAVGDFGRAPAQGRGYSPEQIFDGVLDAHHGEHRRADGDGEGDSQHRQEEFIF